MYHSRGAMPSTGPNIDGGSHEGAGARDAAEQRRTYIAGTLADGIVEDNELRRTIPKIEAVIQECASLKYLLEDLCTKRKKKSKADRTVSR